MNLFETMKDKENLKLVKICVKKDKRIHELEQWIEEEASMNNTCTYNILGAVCSDCMCERNRN